MTHTVRMYEPLRGSYVSLPDVYGVQVCIEVPALICVTRLLEDH